MEKTSQKATKDPTTVEQGKKSYKTHLKKLKEKILEDNQPPTSSTLSTCDPTSSTCDPTSSACDPARSTSSHSTRSNDTYVYGAGMLAVLAIGVCVFFTYLKNKKTRQ